MNSATWLLEPELDKDDTDECSKPNGGRAQETSMLHKAT
ncbi:rCG55093 [Rattus norvegicus]|uniref:RCG55093 n=1 Tax=Rattus norvegicus TaxID=10116 RepID=A6IJC7_RAT|nr:rCG55093 [Rattus norvegicus]